MPFIPFASRSEDLFVGSFAERLEAGLLCVRFLDMTRDPRCEGEIADLHAQALLEHFMTPRAERGGDEEEGEAEYFLLDWVKE